MSLTEASGPLSAKFPLLLKVLAIRHWLVDCIKVSVKIQFFFFFPVLDPCRLVISFIVLVHVAAASPQKFEKRALTNFRVESDPYESAHQLDCSFLLPTAKAYGTGR